jgi:L-ribulose-5-phosphate 3-epimerase
MLAKSLNYWSCPGGLDGTLDPLEFLHLAKQSGYACAELAIGDTGSAFPVDADEAFCSRIRAAADELGLELPSLASGLYWSRNLGDADPSSQQMARHDLERMLRIARRLGAKTLLTIPGAVEVFFLPYRPAQPYEEVWRNATDGIRTVLPVAQECGVRIGIENVWNKFLMSPHEMAGFIDQFDSPWVGAYVDVANLLPFGTAEDWLRTLGHRVVGVHFKDFRKSVGTADGFVDLLEGDVNWPAVMAALRDIEYSGPVVAEMIPLYRHAAMVRVEIASRAMDAILAM